MTNRKLTQNLNLRVDLPQVVDTNAPEFGLRGCNISCSRRLRVASTLGSNPAIERQRGNNVQLDTKMLYNSFTTTPQLGKTEILTHAPPPTEPPRTMLIACAMPSIRIVRCHASTAKSPTFVRPVIFLDNSGCSTIHHGAMGLTVSVPSQTSKDQTSLFFFATIGKCFRCIYSIKFVPMAKCTHT